MIGAMTYDQLVAFLAVAGEGTFTAASAALHKSQPAVSKLVRNLEDELGVQLFDRQQYRATLTDAGSFTSAPRRWEELKRSGALAGEAATTKGRRGNVRHASDEPVNRTGAGPRSSSSRSKGRKGR